MCKHSAVKEVPPFKGAYHLVPVCTDCGEVMGTTSPIDDTINGTARVKDGDNNSSRYTAGDSSSGASTRYMSRITDAYRILKMPRCEKNSYFKAMMNIINKVVLPDKQTMVKKSSGGANFDKDEVRLSRSEEVSASFAAVYYVTVLYEGWWTTKRFLERFRDKSEFNLARRTALKYRNAHTPNVSWNKVVGRIVLDNECLHVVCHHVNTIVNYMNMYIPIRKHKNAIECVVAGAIITLLKQNPMIPRVTTRNICEAASVNPSTASDISEEMYASQK